MKYQPIIGLEIHVQLKTRSKMFCGCDNRGEDAPPNTTVCPICMGHPGTLPVLNDQALHWGILAGLAIGCEIPAYSKFDRKNYFYPDLPKGYQISQYDLPIAVGGAVDIEIPGAKETRRAARIRITRAHLEEDAAKLLHELPSVIATPSSSRGEQSPQRSPRASGARDDNSATYVDFNRAGTPLLEIVSEPDLRTPLEAKVFLQELRLIMRYLGVSDADMEKGHLRCDANISLQRIDDEGNVIDKGWNPKTEIKNVNSFRAVERALEYEIERQTRLFEMNTPPVAQSTRGWDDARGLTLEQRVKEAAHDYRYFPEPDLPPLDLVEIAEEMRGKLPELPAARRRRFVDEYALTSADARILTDDPAWADFTERVFSELRAWLVSSNDLEGTDSEIDVKTKDKLARLVGGWITSKLMGEMATRAIDIRVLKVTPENFAEFITLIYQNKIGSAAARDILGHMVLRGEDPSQIMEDRGLGQIESEEELGAIVRRVVEHNPNEVARCAAGDIKLLKFLVGVVMKETEGRANPKVAERLLKDLIEKSGSSR
ncbi:Asp-tRNA(Asn)/Glu-tRNA(Gln) amidotransferase subunit GatB [Candidatus Uhrbacteria bacterium]|nr:Asp-tRNA(Asn)/Glu-tRNA(Gln) amidotransferase subunit GatB [Candidatus Uhrbacteria bacterium]